MAPQPAANGVLPVAVLQKNAPASTPRGPKAPSPRLKLVCRRLPPGLTQAEFETILGDDWKLGGGKVDWFRYHKGKISKEYAPRHLTSRRRAQTYNAAVSPNLRSRLAPISALPSIPLL